MRFVVQAVVGIAATIVSFMALVMVLELSGLGDLGVPELLVLLVASILIGRAAAVRVGARVTRSRQLD